MYSREVTCSTCGAENEAGRKFCAECGARLALTCAACGTSNRPGAKFCGECGASLGPAQAGVTPAASVGGHLAGATDPAEGVSAGAQAARAATRTGSTPTAERRLVSVLFADLVGFTALSESRDAEEVRELLSRYFETARQVIGRYGGTIEKFIGDAVMAVWGTPVAQEDDAERAVRAALELTDAIGRLGTEAEASNLVLRAGVMTGEAAVTLGADGQGMVAGDLVNTTSRLQAAAPPGAVLVGEATHRSAREAIVFEPVGEQALKGKELPVSAWRAVRVVAKRGGAGRSEGLEAPFVGRDDELRLLKELHHATARERRTRLVSVIGQGGIGKSRLAWEFLKYIDGLIEDVYWHQGRSPAYGEGIAFWALGEMVRRRCGIAETDDSATTREKLASTLEDYIPDDAERQWIAPGLATLLGLEDAPRGEREELFATWRAFFERVADRGPTVLVFEDLQWADSGLLDFIEHLLEWSRSKPILVVTLARPELIERRPNWGAGQRAFTSLHLEPLSDSAMSELVRGLVPGLPDGVVRQLVHRAEGIPLYAVETIRMLLDQGRVSAGDDGYRPVGKLDRLEVPETLQALIAARLDALDPSDRALLQQAAILGQSFTVTALAAITGESSADLEPRLRRLVRKEVLALDVDPRSPERGQFGFVQGVIREVAYGTLPKRERRAGHLAAARYFEALGDDELAGVLANHYLDAYRATPDGPEADALATQARIALRAAGDRAWALHSYPQALAYLEQALSITREPEEQIAVRERAARAAFAADRLDVAEAHGRTLLSWYRDRGDVIATARITRKLGTVLLFASRLADARDLLEQGVAEFGHLASEPEVVRLTAELARVYLFGGEYVKALETIDRSLETAERLDLLPTIAELLASKGWATAEVGRGREAIALLRGAVVLCEKHGFTNAFMRSSMNLSAFGALDDVRDATEVARRGLEFAQRLGFEGWSLGAAGNWANGAFLAGEWQAVIDTLTDLDRPSAPAVTRAGLVTVASAIHAYRGHPETAEALIAPFRDELAELTDPQVVGGLAWVEYHLAFADARVGDSYRQAKVALELPLTGTVLVGTIYAGRAGLWLREPTLVNEALGKLGELPHHGAWLDASRRTLEAGLAGLEGEVDGAQARYREAIAAWRAGDLRFELALTLLECAMLVPHRSDAAAADEAHEILRSLGAESFFERMYALGARDGSRRAASAAPPTMAGERQPA